MGQILAEDILKLVSEKNSLQIDTIVHLYNMGPVYSVIFESAQMMQIEDPLFTNCSLPKKPFHSA